MARFIALSTFKEFYETTADLLDPVNLNKFRSRLLEARAEVLQKHPEMRGEDFRRFIDSLGSQSSVLFYEWVEANSTLIGALNGKACAKEFIDGKGILKHQLSDEFRIFISPVLADSLLKLTPQNDKERQRAMSYLVLLDEDHRLLTEQQFFQPLKDQLQKLESDARGFTEEQQLVDRIKPLCDEAVIAVVNSLSKASYASKLYYVDTLLGSLRTRACTVRFANWVLKEMEKVALNKEHQYKITDLRNDLREGKIQVRNHGKGKSPLRRRDVVTLGLLLLIGSSIFYFLYFKPFSLVKETEFGSSASFKKFTKEERKHIDSLINTMKTQIDPEEQLVDPGYTTVSGGPLLTIRKEFENELMETIYDDFSKDARLKASHVDTCNGREQKFVLYPGVKDLAGRSAKVKSAFRNNSDYDAILYVSVNKKGGDVYSILIKKGEQKEVNLAKGDVILLVYGSKFSRYVAPGNAGGSALPSDNFKHHFCDTDVNYEESINVSYRYKDNTRNKTKFIISGANGNYVELIDVYDVLDDYGS